MNPELSSFAARLHGLILDFQSPVSDRQFEELSVELFRLQFEHNEAYRRICRARNQTPYTVRQWTQIPFVPTSAFKELELTCIPAAERTSVFHSSGTTGQKPSRHYQCPESLKLYEASLWRHFQSAISDLQFSTGSGDTEKLAIGDWQLAMLTPPPEQAPNSSLVHMFEIIWQKFGGASVPASRSPFCGNVGPNGVWNLDFETALAALADNSKRRTKNAKLILGTAFSFVHLLDYLAEKNLRLQLLPGSRVMETGGYKNRSRSMPKTELHALITERLGVPRENILCEYGMSELSSQAYDCEIHPPSSILHPRAFHFPPWARAQIISPETGREVAEGEPGLIRIYDLANVFSVAAIQTEDLGVRRADGFELVGRAQQAEPRGCSLMTA